MDPIGIVIAAVAVAAASAFALVRRHTDGRFRKLAPTATHSRLIEGDRVPTFIQFSGEYCAQCKRNRVLFERLAQDRDDFRFREIAVEDDPQAVDEFAIRRTPTVFLVNAAGELVSRTEGALSIRTISESLDELIGASA